MAGGARYDRWHHLRVEGDANTAAQHLPTARKLLGAVVADAERLELGTLKRTQRIDAGTEIEAEIIGSQPRITIRVSGTDSKTTDQRIGDFVVWARDDVQPNGINDQHPQQILKPEWRTYFFDEEVLPAYDAFPRRKGTYRFSSGVEVFPDGIKHAGNIDWLGSIGERISWYGPSSRYWFDRWRQPSAQYGRFVFMLGQILLDIDAYCAASSHDFAERLVLGAALDGTSLLVMQADMPDLPAPSVPVGRPGDVYVTPPCPVDEVALRLVRYPLLLDLTEPPTQRVFVATGEHVTLWVGTGIGWVNPWFFNADGTRAESFAMPEQTGLHQYIPDVGAAVYDTPSASSEHLSLAIAPSSASLATQDCALELNQEEAFAPVAVDYDYRGNRVLLEFGYRAFGPVPVYSDGDENQASTGVAPWANYLLRANGREVRIFEYTDADATLARWRRLVTMDLRFRTYSFIQTEQFADWQVVVNLHIESRPDLTVTCTPPIAEKLVVDVGPPPHTGWQALCWWAGVGAIAPLAMLVGVLKLGIEGVTFGPGFYLDNGFNPMWYLPAASQLFGTQAFYARDNGSVLIAEFAFTSLGYTTFWNNRPDTEGRRNPVSLAVGDNHLMYSGPGWFADYNDGDFDGFHFVTGDTLGSLTGVAAQDPSYHPIWVLGEIPLIAR